jgi:hypothetical protein
MRLLVLGGTHHVGRAVVEAALARGDEVTTLTRGVSGPPAAGARALHADRTKPGELPALLGGAVWDAVIDTWSGAPHAVRDAARLLASQAGHYCYVSSRSVYRWPIPPGADESAPVVEADPTSVTSDDGRQARPGNHAQPPRGRHRITGPSGLGPSGRHREGRHSAMDRAAGLGSAGQRDDRRAGLLSYPLLAADGAGGGAGRQARRRSSGRRFPAR